LGLHRAIEAPPSSTSGVNSLCDQSASHRQYSTIAYWAQQEAGVGRDPRPQGGLYQATATSSRSNMWLVIGRMRLVMSRARRPRAGPVGRGWRQRKALCFSALRWLRPPSDPQQPFDAANDFVWSCRQADLRADGFGRCNRVFPVIPKLPRMCCSRFETAF